MSFLCDFVGKIIFLEVLSSFYFQVGDCAMCPTEHFRVFEANRTSRLTWLQTVSDNTQLHLSMPHRCLDKYKHYVTRTCEESGWVPNKSQVSCSYSIDEHTIRMRCPPNYITFPRDLDDIRICFRIIANQPWSNACLSSGSPLTLNELNVADRILVQKHFHKSSHHHTNSYFGPPIWLPAKQMWLKKSINPSRSIRNVENQTIESSIQWTLAGIHGVQVPFRNIELEHQDGCLVTQMLSPVNIRRVLTDCDDQNYMICLYNQHEPTMLTLSCPLGYKTTRYAEFQNVCIKIHRFATPQPRHVLSDAFVEQNICTNVFSINSGATLHIFKELALNEELNESDRCLFKVIPEKVIVTTMDWMQLDMSRIAFVNWSFNVTAPSESFNRTLMTMGNGQWIWEANAATCAICFIENEILMPIIELYKYEKNSLMVRIENEQFLWRDHRSSNGFSCFVFIYATGQIKIVSPIYDNVDGNAKLFKIPTKEGEGKYWCTGLQIRSFRVIETEIVHVERLIQFAIIVRRPYTTFLVHWIVKRFRDFITSYLDPQHLFVEDVSLNVTTLDFLLFHVVVLIKSDDYLTFEENRLNVSDAVLAVYYVRQKLNAIRSSANETSFFHILSLNSTVFCLPKSISQLNPINWGSARIGQYITSVEFCLLPTGLPITKRCIGDSLFGGVWLPLPQKFECDNDLQSDVTYDLHNLINSYLTSENTSRALCEMVDIVFDTDHSSLIAADVFYVSQIMKDVANYMPTYPLDNNDVLEVLRLYDRLLMVDQNTTRSAASLNTTNVLLNILDMILVSVVTESDPATYYVTNDGVFSVVQPRLSTFIFYPLVTDITGIAFLNSSNSTVNEWTEYEVQYLYQNQTVSDILATDNLIIASYIPAYLLSELHDPELHIIMTVFINDVLFQTNHPKAILNSSNPYIKSSGNIISVLMPNAKNNLPGKLPIFVKPHLRNEDEIENVCGYWNYTNSINGWSMNGCALTRSSITSSTILCECTHLTHFAYLFHGHSSIETNHIKKLNLITLIGCSLSLAGVLGIYLTAISFPTWRKASSTKFLLQFSTAIAFEMVMILFVNTQANSLFFILADKMLGCIAIGALMHYSVLVTFLWMFIIAYMQFMRYVIVFHKLKTSNFFFKASLFGWCLPILPVIIVLVIDPESYVPDVKLDNYKICYPSGYPLYFAVMAPIALITAVNLVIFLLVINSLTNSLKTGTHVVKKKKDKSTILSQLRLSIFLFFLLGLTWIFAFLSTSTTGLVFTYLFCLTATLQGFVLFGYFVILDPVARSLWIGLLKRMCCKKVN